MTFALEAEEQWWRLRCIFGNPFRPVPIDPRWPSADVVRLARLVYDLRSFEAHRVLSDALHDAGGEDAALLGHCRGGEYVRECWAIDVLLGKE